MELEHIADVMPQQIDAGGLLHHIVAGDADISTIAPAPTAADVALQERLEKIKKL